MGRTDHLPSWRDRRYSDAYADGNSRHSHAYQHGCGNGHPNPDGNNSGYRHAHGYIDRYSHTYCRSDGYPDTDRDIYADPNANLIEFSLFLFKKGPGPCGQALFQPSMFQDVS